VSLEEELERIAELARRYAQAGESLSGILAAEPHEGQRIYLCAFEAGDGEPAWLALDAEGRPVESRTLVRQAASISALSELAEETAGGGDLDDLLSRLVALRMTEAPEGIEEAEEAVRELQRTIEPAPRVATPHYLDRLGNATRRLEQALGEGGSPFAEGMQHGIPAVEKLADTVQANYKIELS
jgi:hypothetical protein